MLQGGSVSLTDYDDATNEWCDVHTVPRSACRCPHEPPRSTWARENLAEVLSESYVPEMPAYLMRDDGARLIYAGRIHSVHGESESGKSFVMQAVCAGLMMDGHRILYLDFESDAQSVLARLRSLGATTDALARMLTYVRPDSGLGDPLARADLDSLLSQTYSLAVIDGVTEALTLVAPATGTPEDQVVTFGRRLPKRIVAATGAAVVMIDHVTKSKDSRGRFALGSQHKMNMLTGPSYTVEVEAPMGIGLRGELVLRVGKDRPGQVRPRCGPMRSDRTQEAARIILDSTSPGRTVMTVHAPRSLITDASPGPFRPTYLMQRVSEYLEAASAPRSGRQVRDEVRGNAQHIATALERLVIEEYVTREAGTRGSHLHRSVRPFREETDLFRFPPYKGGNQEPVNGHRSPVPGNHSGTTQEQEPLNTAQVVALTLAGADE